MGDPAGIGLEIALKAWSERIDKAARPVRAVRRPRCRRRARAQPRPDGTARDACGDFRGRRRVRDRAAAAPRPAGDAGAARLARYGQRRGRDRVDRAGGRGRVCRRGGGARDQPDCQARARAVGLSLSGPHRVPGGARRAACPRQEIPPRHDAGIARAARRAADGALRAGVGAGRDHARADLRDGAHHL